MLCEFSCLCHSLHHMHCYGCSRSSGLSLNRNRRKRPKVDARIFGSALSHTRRSGTSKKREKIAYPLWTFFPLDKFRVLASIGENNFLKIYLESGCRQQVKVEVDHKIVQSKPHLPTLSNNHLHLRPLLHTPCWISLLILVNTIKHHIKRRKSGSTLILRPNFLQQKFQN